MFAIVSPTLRSYEMRADPLSRSVPTVESMIETLEAGSIIDDCAKAIDRDATSLERAEATARLRDAGKARIREALTHVS